MFEITKPYLETSSFVIEEDQGFRVGDMILYGYNGFLRYARVVYTVRGFGLPVGLVFMVLERPKFMRYNIDPFDT